MKMSNRAKDEIEHICVQLDELLIVERNSMPNHCAKTIRRVIDNLNEMLAEEWEPQE